MQLLIADDSPTSLLQLKYLCHKLGYDPQCFSGGEALWSYIIDLKESELIILLDWDMPDLDGPTLCKRIRVKYPEWPVHIILVTARDETQSLVLGLDAGADDYVTKPINTDELTARMSVGLRNIALHKTLNEINEQRLIAERLVTVAQLASGAAHEINNPISFVKSNLELLKRESDKLPKLLAAIGSEKASLESIRSVSMDIQLEYLAQDLQDISSESLVGVNRVQSIVAGLLRFNSEQGFVNQDINLNQLLQAIAPPSALLNIETNLRLLGDEEQLHLMFNAIVSNALQAIEKEGTILISAHKKNNEIEVHIKDTGIGIAAEHKAHVFDPFFTLRPVGQGVGLGLSLALGIAKRHGGTLTLDSAQGVGTTVIFSCHAA